MILGICESPEDAMGFLLKQGKYQPELRIDECPSLRQEICHRA